MDNDLIQIDSIENNNVIKNSFIEESSNSECEIPPESIAGSNNDDIIKSPSVKVSDVPPLLKQVNCDIDEIAVKNDLNKLSSQIEVEVNCNVKLPQKRKNSDESDVTESVMTLNTKISTFRRKQLSDIYKSDSDNEAVESISPKTKNVDSVCEINLISKRKKTEMNIPNFNCDDKASTSKQEKLCSDSNETSLKSQKNVPKKSSKGVSDQLKKMIVDAIEAGVCNRQTAASVFKVPYSTVVHIYKKFLETGVIGKLNRDEKLQDEHVKFLADTLAENCTYTIKDLTTMLSSKYAIDVSSASVSKKIAAFHYNIKRVPEFSIIDVTQDIMKDHKEYCQLFMELHNSGRPMVYFDEADFTVMMRRFSGRVDPGVKGQVTAPSLRTRHRTLLVTLSGDELFYYKTLPESRTRGDLVQYVEALCRLLTKHSMVGTVLVMGTGTIGVCDDVSDVARAAGYEVLFLPTQNRWFNPVETLFARWTDLVKGKRPANEKEVESVVDSLAALVTDKQCHKFVTDAVDNARRCLEDSLDYDH